MRLISKAQLLAKKEQARKDNHQAYYEDLQQPQLGKFQSGRRRNDKGTKRNAFNTGKTGRNKPNKEYHQL